MMIQWRAIYFSKMCKKILVTYLHTVEWAIWSTGIAEFLIKWSTVIEVGVLLLGVLAFLGENSLRFRNYLFNTFDLIWAYITSFAVEPFVFQFSLLFLLYFLYPSESVISLNKASFLYFRKALTW